MEHIHWRNLKIENTLVLCCLVTILYPIFNGVIYSLLALMNIDQFIIRILLLALETFMMFIGFLICLKLKWKKILTISIIILVVLISNYYLFDNKDIIMALSKDLIYTYIIFWLFYCLKDKQFVNVFYLGVPISALLCLIYGITLIGNTQLNMQWFSYQLMFPICGLIIFPLKNKFINIAILIILFIFSFISGSRLPLGIEIVLIASIFIRKYYLHYKSEQETKKRVLRKQFYLIGFLSIIMALIIKPIATQLDIMTRRQGNVVRIFRLIATGDIFKLGGRMENYYLPIIDSILSNPLLGTGICSDRKIIYESFIQKGIEADYEITSVYSHNIFLEILTSFGIVIGTFLFYVFFKFSYLKYRMSEDHKALVLLYFIGFFPLLLSGSFLIYNWFWILLAFVCKDFNLKMIFQRRSMNDNSHM